MATFTQANSTPIKVNGHDIELFHSSTIDIAEYVYDTDWFLIKFTRFVDYDLSQSLLQMGLEVHENLGDNAHLCRYQEQDLEKIRNLDFVSHLNKYPSTAVAMAKIEGLGNNSNTSESNITSFAPSFVAPNRAEKKPFIVAMHPNPCQTPLEILDKLNKDFRAEHIDEKIIGNIIRVRLDPTTIPEISKIDSIRTIDNIRPVQPRTVRQRAILGFSDEEQNAKWQGQGEIVWVADSGFDKGLSDDVHDAFTGRVLAATVEGNWPGDFQSPADFIGHGTHVAGSVLGFLEKASGTETSNLRGTAPKAKLISIQCLAAQGSNPEGILTKEVEHYGQPTILNNSWGEYDWTDEDHKQYPYGIGDAGIVDKVMYENPNTCIVWAAGNDGGKVGDNGMLQQIGGYASAKNCITVGATYSDRPMDRTKQKYQLDGRIISSMELAEYSSTGPTENTARLKPDVVAPGHVVLSARSREMTTDELQDIETIRGQAPSKDLLWMRGTSMATPAITGCVAVLRGAIRDTHRVTPTGAMLKALIVHGTTDLIDTRFTINWENATPGPEPEHEQTRFKMPPAPNPFQGYGLVNINKSLQPILSRDPRRCGFKDCETPNGFNRTPISIPKKMSRLVVTLAYTDLPGDELQNIIHLWVKSRDDAGYEIRPLVPVDLIDCPHAQTSNVTKISETNVGWWGEADIVIQVQTIKQTAKYAVAWAIEEGDAFQ